MSHHFDYPQNEADDITDAFCFAGAADSFGPRTVFGMNTSPTYGIPWNPAVYYEHQIDTNGDYVADITFRATFPIAADGTQYVQVEQLTGAAATDRTASGTIITPPNCPVGEVVECLHGIRLFAGQRRDPFYNFIPFPSRQRTRWRPELSPTTTRCDPPPTPSRTQPSGPTYSKCLPSSPASAP
jgi:hypothetical protein